MFFSLGQKELQISWYSHKCYRKTTSKRLMLFPSSRNSGVIKWSKNGVGYKTKTEYSNNNRRQHNKQTIH
jgi:hypothetical protein